MKKTQIFLLSLIVFLLLLTGCKEPTRTIRIENNKPITIYNDDLPYKIENNDQEVDIIPFFVKNGDSDSVVLIIPGGAYDHLSSISEGVEIANSLNSVGINAVILEYRVKPYSHKAIICDAVRAVQFLRYYHSSFGFSENKIIIMGFSAGGHLACMEAEYWKRTTTGTDRIAQVDARPDAIILGYPVISFTTPLTHIQSRQNFLGEKNNTLSSEDINMFSAELNVDYSFPPTFIWHSKTDESVDYKNSIVMKEALDAFGINNELLLFDDGRHGMGLGTEYADASQWFNKCCEWIQGLWDSN